MARIYIESLSREYKKKLKNRELTREEVNGIFLTVADNYKRRKKSFMAVSIMLAVIMGLMVVMTLMYKPEGEGLDGNGVLFIIWLQLLFYIVIMFILYYLGMAKVPLQFSSCLKKGYPQLVNEYGFKAIREYAKKAKDENTNPMNEEVNDLSIEEVKRNIDNLACILKIEDTFNLSNYADLIVVGFLEGRICRGDKVYILTGSNGNYIESEIAAIEIGPRQQVNEAANRHVALGIKNGRGMGIKKGMIVFKRATY